MRKKHCCHRTIFNCSREIILRPANPQMVGTASLRFSYYHCCECALLTACVLLVLILVFIWPSVVLMIA